MVLSQTSNFILFKENPLAKQLKTFKTKPFYVRLLRKVLNLNRGSPIV